MPAPGIRPAECGIVPATLDELKGGSAEENAALARDLLAGGGPVALRDAVALNAGAALYVCGAVPDIAGGYRRAREALTGGTAAAKLEQVLAATRALLAAPAAGTGQAASAALGAGPVGAPGPGGATEGAAGDTVSPLPAD